MKKIMFMLLLSLVTLVVGTTTSSCTHNPLHHADGVDSVIYTAEDSAFVLSIASSLQCNEFDTADDYLLYRDMKQESVECEQLLSTLPKSTIYKLAHISIREYGKVSDVLLTKIFKEHQTLLKYINDDGELDPHCYVPSDSDEVSTQTSNRLKDYGGVD